MTRISGERVALELADGRVIQLDGVFTMSRTRLSPLAEQLGCVLADGPTGPYLHTNETRQASVAGVFACGDASLAAGSVALAVAEGVRAGVGARFVDSRLRLAAIGAQRTRHGRLLSKRQPGIRNCMATLSLRAPRPMSL